MTSSKLNQSRRKFCSSGVGTLALAGIALPSTAAELTPEEQANVDLINEFCAAWSKPQLGKIMSFFTDDSAYRMTETTELAEGINAVSQRIETLIYNVDRFDVLDTFARGPMVVNERIDYFSDFAIKTWHGVGVFFIKEGAIIDWYDYTIQTEA